MQSRSPSLSDMPRAAEAQKLLCLGQEVSSSRPQPAWPWVPPAPAQRAPVPPTAVERKWVDPMIRKFQRALAFPSTEEIGNGKLGSSGPSRCHLLMWTWSQCPGLGSRVSTLFYPFIGFHLQFILSPLPPSSVSFPSAAFPAAAAERDGEQSHVPAHRERP